jgi:hypothetical protein
MVVLVVAGADPARSLADRVRGLGGSTLKR